MLCSIHILAQCLKVKAWSINHKFEPKFRHLLDLIVKLVKRKERKRERESKEGRGAGKMFSWISVRKF